MVNTKYQDRQCREAAEHKELATLCAAKLNQEWLDRPKEQRKLPDGF
jgi:hypothetical protein